MPQDKMDQEANEFAMELLMPTDLLLADLEKDGSFDLLNTEKLGKLAKRYRVDAQLMAMRIGQLRERVARSIPGAR